ncbi:MAG: F-type H+-transporting ATPase subunit b [Actinomycetota bacterium]|nr:F-type H+-transporting ATPase subunit b [Actinomycetota bacterium]
MLALSILATGFLQAAGEAAAPVEKVNPILPATNEILWGAVSFLVLLVFMVKKGFPAVKKGMDARADKIRKSLDEADAAKAEADTILDEYRSKLADASTEAARIIEAARQDADKVRQDLRKQAETEVAEIRERATADINAHVERVKANLRTEMATLTIELAEKVVERSLDRETNMALIESFIEQASRQPAGS